MKELESLNAIYDDFPDPEEKKLLEKMKAKHCELVKGELKGD